MASSVEDRRRQSASGEQAGWPEGVRRLCWSPVSGARSWDGALLMARAMTASSPAGRGTSHEHHWSERSAALLAPLLHAASLTGKPIAEVLRWVLRGDLDPAGKALESHDAEVANDVLMGIARTDGRERSSIFSATAGILAAYNAEATRKAAAAPNFDARRFVASSDTVYITAPAHKQALCAPLVVGLLEQIRHATYEHARERPATPPVFFCLDEIANIAPIHDLPALVSEAGGQHLHILVCLQDLSQARSRWGADAADGFLSLFQTKLILSGIADTRTLEAISLALGEYDRRLVSHNLSQSEPAKFFATRTDSASVSHHTQRHRTLNHGDIARLPPGRGLLLQGAHWELLRLTPWHRTEPWRAVAGSS
jgi:type IV secretion system protein VirD4